MKRYYLLLVVLLIASRAFGQSRSAGQMVVPYGYERYDSLRFGLFDAHDWGPYLSDTLGCKYDYSWGQVLLDTPLYQKKGIVANDYSRPFHYKSAMFFKQRIFSGLPFDGGYYWRHMDSGFCVHNNTYDANDISPFAEFPKSPSLVTQSFQTTRFNTGSD